jgi:hypothetical protein
MKSWYSELGCQHRCGPTSLLAKIYRSAKLLVNTKLDSRNGEMVRRLNSRYRHGMRRTGLLVLYVVAIAIALGGVGDLTVRALFEVHKRFLGTADVPAPTTSLILHLLHALGGGLVGIGIASFALVHFAVRRGERWALWTMLAAVVVSEGANAVGMYAVGSFWYVSVTFIVFAAIGVTLLVAANSEA